MSEANATTIPGCRNCGAPGAGKFCAQCGQAMVLHPPTVVEFARAVVSHNVGAEGSLWRTLYLLCIPGRLTREYLDGRRKRYLHPLRLYLTASFLFFLLVGLRGFDPEVFKVNVSNEPPSKKTQNQPSDGQPLVNINVSGDSAAKPEPKTEDTPVRGVHITHSADGSVEITGPKGKIDLANMSDEDKAAVAEANSAFSRCAQVDAGCSAVMTQIARVGAAWQQNPQAEIKRLTERLQHTMSYAVFAMLPLFALLMALVYMNRHMYFGEHLVFALHQHSLWFLVGAVAILMPEPVRQLIFVIVFAQGVWAMHTVYAGRWWPTFARACLVSLVYGVALSIASSLLALALIVT